MDKRIQSSRGLLWLFVAATIVPAASLAWVGWRMVQQDRELESQRVLENREQAADLAAAALQRILAEAEERLTTFSAAPPAPAASMKDGATLLAIGANGVLAHAGTPLLWYPAIPPTTLADSTSFSKPDYLEFRQNDLDGALRALEEPARSREPAVRGEALLRMARIHWKRKDAAKALDTFAELAKAGGIRVSGLPAGLQAAQGRALIFEALDRRDDLRREAMALCDNLEDGRWVLLRSEFDFSYRQASQWLGQTSIEQAARPPLSADRTALAEAAGSLWQEWQGRVAQDEKPRGRRTIRSGDVSVLLLTRHSPERLTALMISPRFIESAWDHSASQMRDFNFALTDAEGLPVLGRADAPFSLQSLRPASVTQLPWTVHTIVRNGAAASSGLSNRTRLLLAGIALIALLLFAGGYFVNRALLREMTVARLQSDFVAAVSHEFRTPLTTVRQLSEMLARGRVSSDDKRQQFYDTLLAESERLHRLVEGLLNFGRMEAGQVQYSFEAVDPEAFVRNVAAEFQREVFPSGYRIEVTENGTLHRIRADRESLARVFWNLLDNAVKYSPENRTVCVDFSESGARVLVNVRDRGVGIPAAERQEIFRKFVRGAAAKTASIRGTGVGLAMARQIVVAHGGDISVESEPGQGSVFTVLLPVADITEAATA